MLESFMPLEKGDYSSVLLSTCTKEREILSPSFSQIYLFLQFNPVLFFLGLELFLLCIQHLPLHMASS